MHWGDARRLNYPPPDVNIDVSVVARNGTITVFLRVDHNQAIGGSMIFVDALSLEVDPTVPTAVPATDTPVPPPTAVAAALQHAAPPDRNPDPHGYCYGDGHSDGHRHPTPTCDGDADRYAQPPRRRQHRPRPSTPTATLIATLPPRATATEAPDRAARSSATGGGFPPGGSRAMLWGGIGALGGAGILGSVLVVKRRRR